MHRGPDAQYRWFVGLSEGEARSEAVDRLERSSGFVIEHWGVVEARRGDHEMGLRLELGDRALADAERENGGTALERADHVVERAIRSRPLSLLDLLGTGRTVETAWAVEEPANPTVLLVHTSEQLTAATITTHPPGAPPVPLDRLLSLAGVRAIDLHRYRARVNLRPDADRAAVRRAVEEALTPAWGPPQPLPRAPAPRRFPAPHVGSRVVAESLEMAGDHHVLGELFRTTGVAEAILEEGSVRVRPGRLFRWEDVLAGVERALRSVEP